MEDYAESAVQNSGNLEDQVIALKEAWSTFKSALMDSERASQFYDIHLSGGTAAASDAEDWVVRMKNLDNFVGDVAADFMRLIGTLANIDPLGDIQDGNWSFNESAMNPDDIRSVDATETIDQAIEDAAELRDLLAEAGIDPEDFDPEQLGEMYPDDPAYLDLYNQLTDMFDGTGGELYNEVLFNELGADGIAATLGTIEMYQAHQLDDDLREELDVPELDVEDELLNPFLLAFANTTGDLEPEVSDALLDVGDDWWKLHQLSTLIGAHDNLAHDQNDLYDPQFLADASSQVLVENNDLWEQTGNVEEAYYPPLAWTSSSYQALWERSSLNSPHLTAYEALAGNAEAAWLFADKGNDQLEAILDPDTSMMENVGSYYGFDASDRLDDLGLEDLLEQGAADTFTAAFVTAIQEDPSLYNDASSAFNDVVQIVGDGSIPDSVKVAVAGSHIVYLDDIGYAAMTQSTGEFNRPNMVEFYAELAHGPEAMVVLGEGISVWGTQQGAVLATNPDISGPTAMLPVAMVTGAVMHGLETTNADKESALDGWAAGIANGIVVAGAMALVLIPEPTTTAAGTVALSTQLARAGAISAIGLGVSGTSQNAARAIADRDTGTGLHVVDVRNMVMGELRVPLAEALADETGDEMPADIPPAGERWNGEGSWLAETNSLIDRATPEGTGNPVIELGDRITEQAGESSVYADPENDHWQQ